MTKSKNYINQFLFMFLALLCLVSPFFSVITATNAEDIYSNVLTDLQKDETFNVADYPVIEDDYSLQVIQIAESEDKELLVYVYQPSGKLRATTIRLSTSIGNNLAPHDYNLEYLNSNSTLFKYKVTDLQVLSDVVRYYEVISIHREYIEGVDEPPSGEGQIINEVVYDVSQRWTACTLDGNVTYEEKKIDTINIVDKRVGYIEYDHPWSFFVKENFTSHYIAFSTDFPIGDLKEAHVEYYSKRMATGSSGTSPVLECVTLKEIDTVNVTMGLFTKEHEFQRIERVQDFIAKENLKDDIKKEISLMQWVLRFVETDITTMHINGFVTKYWTDISDVTILRLKFETAGRVYNLGVVDNKQTGPNVPDNKPFDLLEWLKTHIVEFLMILLGIIVCVPLFIAFFPQIIAFLGKLVVWLAKGVWYILTLPWQLLD